MSAALADALTIADDAPSSACFHCGQPLPSGQLWYATIGGIRRPTCCPGCQSVAQTIADSGLEDYYLRRTALPAESVAADLAKTLPELRLYDAPETQGTTTAPALDDVDAAEATLSIEGMRCAACAWLIERHVSRVAGVAACNMNVATGRLHVRWNRATCKLSDILLAIRAIGYAAYPFDATREEGQLRQAGKLLFRQLFVAGLSMMQVMMYAVPAYLTQDGIDADMEAMLRWASLLLTLPAVFYSARPFFAGAWNDLKHRTLGMDVPVALGIAAAFLGSVAATVRNDGDVYFDSVTMFVFLLLCSRYLELAARRKAASMLHRLSRAIPSAASRLPDYPTSLRTETIPAARLAIGDIVLVKPGEAIPADAMLIEGEAALDVSLLSGESRPQHKTCGDTLPGGAVNMSQPLLLRVLHPAAESTLSALVRLAERAGQAKPALALRADRVAAWFVAVLLVFAVAVFAWWQMTDPQRAWPVAIAVLVVSCPCALSLATPAALAASTDALARRGVLILRPHVLETLHRADTIVFDKTGTLTTGKFALRAVVPMSNEPESWFVSVAAALEATSAHPLGLALVEAARQRGLPVDDMPAKEARHATGQGVAGTVDGAAYRLGRAAFVQELSGGSCPAWESEECTSIYFGTQGKWLARFDFADTVRDDARETIAGFRAAGKTLILLSGDHPAVVRNMANDLGFDIACGGRTPEEKLQLVRDWQASGAIVAMIGDGINDAAVLRAADVSFAMGEGAVLAQTNADAVLLSERLDLLVDATRTASRTVSVIRQNLTWATLYNLAAIPAAAFGLLNPWWASVGMSASSAAVTLNALRLRR